LEAVIAVDVVAFDLSVVQPVVTMRKNAIMANTRKIPAVPTRVCFLIRGYVLMVFLIFYF